MQRTKIHRLLMAALTLSCLGMPLFNPTGIAEAKDEEASSVNLQTPGGHTAAPQVWHREQTVHILMPQRKSPRLAYGLQQLQ